MRKSVFKYPFEPDDHVLIHMPLGAEILCVQAQHGSPCFWAIVDKDETQEVPRRFIVVGTGHPCDPDPESYVGTFQLHGGALVFHVFEVKP